MDEKTKDRAKKSVLLILVAGLALFLLQPTVPRTGPGIEANCDCLGEERQTLSSWSDSYCLGIRHNCEKRPSDRLRYKCAKMAESIKDRYCLKYVNTEKSFPDMCHDTQWRISRTYDKTAEMVGCNWKQYGGENVTALLTDGEPVVTVENTTYNCIDQGIMNPTCFP